MRQWLNKWIKPKEEPRRKDNQCHCGCNMIVYYSRNTYHCYHCNREYKISNGVEIVHQR
jgi:hypothetical protein